MPEASPSSNILPQADAASDNAQSAGAVCTLPAGEQPVRVEGELSIRNADEVHHSLLAATASITEVVLDLSSVEECDAAGLQLLCAVRRSAAQRGQRFAITGASQAVQSAAEVLGLRLMELPGGTDCGI